MQSLPIIISIPHGGSFIPSDLKKDIILSPLDILEDSDAFTLDIYDISETAEYVFKADIARAIIDLNRSKTQLPPQYFDGVIKSHTCFGKQIYRNGKSLDKSKIQTLIQSYYEPYHNQIKDVIKKNSHIQLALDCHSMASVGPEYSNDKGKERPLMCLGNVWGQTCSEDVMNQLSECFSRSFGFKSTDIQINKPFAGGYITQTYGMSYIPWVQVEISRALYLNSTYFNYQSLQMNINRLKELRQMFQMGVMEYFK